jgi:hypothetical protein
MAEVARRCPREPDGVADPGGSFEAKQTTEITAPLAGGIYRKKKLPIF